MSDAQVTRSCERCHQTSRGAYYTFYYGKHVKGEMQGLAIKHTFRLGGSETVWICNGCRWRTLITHPQLWLMAIVAVLILPLAVTNPNDLPTADLILITVLMPLAANFMISRYLFGMDFFDFLTSGGVRQAIQARKKSLEKAGYTTFFTPKQYQALERK